MALNKDDERTELLLLELWLALNNNDERTELSPRTVV